MEFVFLSWNSLLPVDVSGYFNSVRCKVSTGNRWKIQSCSYWPIVTEIILYWPSLTKLEKKKKLIRVRAAHCKHDYPTLKNQPVILINKAVPFTSTDDSFLKLTRVVEPNNLNPTQMSLNGSCIFSAYLPITQWRVSITAIIEIMLRRRPSISLVRFLYIKGEVYLVKEQNFSLTQNMLPFWNNFYGINNLIEVSCIPTLIGKFSGVYQDWQPHHHLRNATVPRYSNK